MIKVMELLLLKIRLLEKVCVFLFEFVIMMVVLVILDLICLVFLLIFRLFILMVMVEVKVF